MSGGAGRDREGMAANVTAADKEEGRMGAKYAAALPFCGLPPKKMGQLNDDERGEKGEKQR